MVEIVLQVSAYESIISKGGKVNEKDVVNLIELLMNQLLKLDGIMADGDVKLQRKMQVNYKIKIQISPFLFLFFFCTTLSKNIINALY